MKRLIPPLLLLIPFMYACSDFEPFTDSVMTQGGENADDLYLESPLAEEFPSPEPVAIPMPDKLIKTGYMGIEVDQYADRFAELQNVLFSHQAYISNQNEQHGSNYVRNELIIRVPNGDFDGLMEDLAGLASRIDYKRAEMQDVTEEFVDVEARIKAKKAVEARYVSLLSEAQDIGEILEIEDKIRVIREELEVAQGRMRVLQDKIALSTIHLQLQENYPQTLAEFEDGGFWGDVGSGLGAGWDAILLGLVGLAHIWPALLGMLVLLVILRHNVRKRKKGTVLA